MRHEGKAIKTPSNKFIKGERPMKWRSLHIWNPAATAGSRKMCLIVWLSRQDCLAVGVAWQWQRILYRNEQPSSLLSPELVWSILVRKPEKEWVDCENTENIAYTPSARLFSKLRDAFPMAWALTQRYLGSLCYLSKLVSTSAYFVIYPWKSILRHEIQSSCDGDSVGNRQDIR